MDFSICQNLEGKKHTLRFLTRGLIYDRNYSFIQNSRSVNLKINNKKEVQLTRVQKHSAVLTVRVILNDQYLVLSDQ